MNMRLMIRLIDVALIILLGFIAISRLKTEYVALPAGGNPIPPNHKPHEAYVHVFKNSFNFQDAGYHWKCQTLKELEKIIVNRQKRYHQQQVKLVINIQPHRASIMQKLVDVIDLCERNHIEKNLDYENYN